MTKLVFYITTPEIEKKWSLAVGDTGYIRVAHPRLIFSYNPDNSIILVQSGGDSVLNSMLDKLLCKKYKIIFFSNTPNTEEALSWFQKGIKGYLNTHAHPDRIRQAIKTVSSGNIWLGQSVMQAMIASSLKPKMASSDGWKKLVTQKEACTLDHLLTGKANKDIADVMCISERTVKAHVSNLFKKFNTKDRLALVLHIQNWQE